MTWQPPSLVKEGLGSEVPSETLDVEEDEEGDEKFSQSQNQKPQIRHTHHRNSRPPHTIILHTSLFFFFTAKTTSSSQFAHPYFTAALMAARRHGHVPPLRNQHIHRLRMGFWPRSPFRLLSHSPRRLSVGPGRQGLRLFTRDLDR